MARSSRDRFSVDLRGLKAALFERARFLGVLPSDLVRKALAEMLGTESPQSAPMTDSQARSQEGRSRLCLRMPGDAAQRIVANARAAGLSPGTYVAGVMAGVPALSEGGREGQLSALVTSNAELADVRRQLVKWGNSYVQRTGAESEARVELAALLAAVAQHLAVSSAALAEIQPRSWSAPSAARNGHRRS